MLVDARTVPDGAKIECDICIVGAGAAGLSIALQFIGQGRNLCIVESGDVELDPATQALYEGDNVGLPYFALDVCRLRQFGGTTNHWAGYCLPFKHDSFEEDSWLPNSGWPIDLADMQPFIERAVDQLDLPDAGWDIGHWEEATGERALPFDQTKILNEILLVKPVRMGQVLRPEFEQAKNVQVYLNANAVEIETGADAAHVTGVRVQTLAGNRLTVAGRIFVIALGGIENPRLMLLSDSVQKEGLGNGNDLVGRYFLEHPVFRGGIIQPSSPGVAIGFYQKLWFGDDNDHAIFPISLLAPDLRRSEEITPIVFQFFPVFDDAYKSKGLASLKQVGRHVAHGRMPDDLMTDIGNILSDADELAGLAFDRVWYGQAPVERIDVVPVMVLTPNPDSRVLLGDQTDALGLRRVKLDWRLTELDKRSVRRGLEIMAGEIGRLDVGRMKILLSDDATTWPDDLEGANHHMGTTRMHDDPAKGVVDKNCKVHGIDNLYVAGSSVFPTPGIGTPTLMIIALALRLADHLKGQPA